MENIASDHDESDVEELPEVDISVLSVQPYMFEPKYYHLRNIVERERKEISKEEYKDFQLGPEPISHTEPPENY